jgi:hypothetical protein
MAKVNGPEALDAEVEKRMKRLAVKIDPSNAIEWSIRRSRRGGGRCDGMIRSDNSIDVQFDDLLEAKSFAKNAEMMGYFSKISVDQTANVNLVIKK